MASVRVDVSKYIKKKYKASSEYLWKRYPASAAGFLSWISHEQGQLDKNTSRWYGES